MGLLGLGGTQPYDFMQSTGLKKDYFNVLGLDEQGAVDRVTASSKGVDTSMMQLMREQADADRRATIDMNAAQIAAADRANIPWERQLQESDRRYGLMTSDARKNAAIAQQYDMEKQRERSAWEAADAVNSRSYDTFNKNNAGLMGMASGFFNNNQSRWG